MALTADQDIPNKPEVREPWSFRRLFSFGAANTLAKVFTNPFDILLGFLVLIVGITELLGRRISWPMWVFIILILLCNLLERHSSIIFNIKPEKKEK